MNHPISGHVKVYLVGFGAASPPRKFSLAVVVLLRSTTTARNERNSVEGLRPGPPRQASKPAE